MLSKVHLSSAWVGVVPSEQAHWRTSNVTMYSGGCHADYLHAGTQIIVKAV